MVSDTPRPSRSSATASPDRVAVPRSMTFDSRNVPPSASAGSQIDPALSATLIATTGVLRVSLATTVAPFGSWTRDGARLRLWLLVVTDIGGVPYPPNYAASPAGSGMNQPSVRFATLNMSRARPPTSSLVVAVIRAGNDSKTTAPPMVSKY